MKAQKIIGIICMFLIFVNVVAAVDYEDQTYIIMSLVNQDPDPAAAGDIVEVRVGLENRGGLAAENRIVEVIPEYPFTVLTGESSTQDAGTLKAFQVDADMKIVKFKLRVDRDATAGTYELKFMEYEEGKKSQATIRTLNIEIENKESAEVIYIDQVELIPGKITPMTFTVNNVGSSPLRELTFRWENEDDIILPVGSDNTKYIKYIDIGESAEIDFDVIASAIADPDLYKLDLTLTYNDPTTGEDTEINTKAGVYVGGATDFDAAFSGVSSGEASFSISNIGSVSASSVTVKIPDQKGWKVSGSNSVIIGNLNEGDYTIASFQLSQTGTMVGGTKTKTGQSTKTTNENNAQTAKTSDQSQDPAIKLEVIYTDSRGNRNTIEKTVSVDRASFGGASGIGTKDREARKAEMKPRNNPLNSVWSTGKWILLGIFLIVGFVFINKRYKKARMNNPGLKYVAFLKSFFKKKQRKK